MTCGLRIVAKALGGIAAVVFVCPARLFSRNFAPGILIQIAVAGIFGLIALMGWHVGDASDRQSC